MLSTKTIFAALLVLPAAVMGASIEGRGIPDFKANEYRSSDCSGSISYAHKRPEPFCLDIDSSTRSIYVNTVGYTDAAFHKGSYGRCEKDYEPMWRYFNGKNRGSCIKLRGGEKTMGFE